MALLKLKQNFKKPFLRKITFKTNDLKTGTRIRLRNGWNGTLKDNKKGNTRIAEVEGFCKVTGSIYSHDIVSWFSPIENSWQPVEHTKAQLDFMKMVNDLF